MRAVAVKMCWYILLVLGIWLIVSFLTHRFLARSKKNMMIKDISKKSSNVLFVIAHPDDECMFFGPAITSMTQPVSSDSSGLRKKAKHVYLLCLSDGNHHNWKTFWVCFSTQLIVYFWFRQCKWLRKSKERRAYEELSDSWLGWFQCHHSQVWIIIPFFIILLK